jgi:hypothetical protein
MQKAELIRGPSIRTNKHLIVMLEYCCFSMNKSPNAGTPEILRLGIKKFAEEKPEEFEFAVKKGAKHLGLSVETLKQLAFME